MGRQLAPRKVMKDQAMLVDCCNNLNSECHCFLSQIAYEAIANIRTVKSLNLEETMENLFTEKLQAPHKYAAKCMHI